MPVENQIEIVDIDDLRPYEQNARTHSPEQIDMIAGSLREFGWTNPVLVDRDLNVVAGHGRLEAARKLGWTDVEIKRLEDLNAEQVRLYRIADNRIAELAGWDNALLAREFEALAELDVDLELSGFASDEIDALVDESAAMTPERDGDLRDGLPPAEPVTHPGDVWILGRHRLGCGDSERLFGSFVDGADGLVLTDPPYGIDAVKLESQPDKRTGKTGLVGSIEGRGFAMPRVYERIAGDDRPFDPTWLLSVGEAQIIWGGQYFASRLTDRTGWICWDKGVAEGMSFSNFELAWTSFAGRNRMYRHLWSGMRREGDRRTELADRVHPTQKPVGLLVQILETVGVAYSLVLDPYAGSGSTVIAAEALGRECRAMELSPGYCDVIVERWQNYTGRSAERVEGGLADG